MAAGAVVVFVACEYVQRSHGVQGKVSLGAAAVTLGCSDRGATTVTVERSIGSSIPMAYR